ncbi:MAG: peptidoglycan DD-metalloendopeptidase family protein [Bdellovibrionales bacterium]|nr:peptidoglycan DD-metalloendopeptidase family protein [Bdellovibrionales bacterium]
MEEIDQRLVKKIDEAKISVSEAERKQRRLYKQVISSDKKVRSMSDERSKLNDKVLRSEADAQELAYEVREWTRKVRTQREKIGKSVAHIYQLKNPSALTFLFSDQSASEIEKNVRFLKRISESDFKRFKTYQKSLQEAKKAKEALNKEVTKLLSLRRSLQEKEIQLLSDQRKKMALLKDIRSNKERNLKLLKKLRAQLPELDQEVEVAFFEQKGKLFPPLPIKRSKGYGSEFDSVYRVKMLHLGWTFEPFIQEPVKATFDGKVAYVGQLPGFGPTIIIDHGDHYYSVYSKNSEVKVFEGEKVFKGQTIALSGSELYFELRHYSNAIDPEKWISYSEAQDIASSSVEAPGEHL